MPGTRFGPRAILEASRQVEFYDEELDTECYRIGITTLREIEVEPTNLAVGLDRLEEVAANTRLRSDRCARFERAIRSFRCFSSTPILTCARTTRERS